jgi:hypothetical protein
MLATSPYVHTQQDVLFEVWLERQAAQPKSERERARLREEFFRQPQACLRSSPLPKKFGWGLIFDQEGRVALCPMESPQYEHMASGKMPGIRLVKAMRSKRG